MCSAGLVLPFLRKIKLPYQLELIQNVDDVIFSYPNFNKAKNKAWTKMSSAGLVLPSLRKIKLLYHSELIKNVDDVIFS